MILLCLLETVKYKDRLLRFIERIGMKSMCVCFHMQLFLILPQYFFFSPVPVGDFYQISSVINHKTAL